MTEDTWQLSALAVKTVPPFRAVVQQAQLTVPKIPHFAEGASTSLMQLTQAHGITIVGPPVFIYTGAGTGANDLLTMQVAMPVEQCGASLPVDTAVLEFAEFRCAAVDFKGPIMHLPEAYAPAMDALSGEGYTAVEQSREVYKHWVGYDEPDNIVEIQFGIR